MIIIELSFIILINILYIYSLKEYDKLFGKKKIADIFLIILLLFVGKYVSIYEFKILNEIKFFKFLFNSSLSLNVYIGIISILLALYIYCISIGDNFKKYLLINLLGEGKVLFLSTLVLVLYFFEISPVLFLGINLLIFTEIFKMIKLTFLVLDTSALKEEKFKNEIIPKIYNFENTKGLSNLYHEIKKSINKALADKNFIYLKEMIFYYTELLTYEKFDSSKNEIFKDEENKTKIFVYSIYEFLIDNPDKNCYEIISDTNIKLGEYYLKHENYDEALSYYKILKLKYKYLLKNETEDLGFNLFEGIRYYEDKFEKEEDQIVILRAVLSLFKMMVEKGDYENLSEFQEILGTGYSEKNLLKEYARLILLFFLENDKKVHFDKNKSVEKSKLIKKIKSYYSFNNIDLLENLYIKDKEENLKEKFKYNMYEKKINVLGIPDRSNTYSSIQDIILKILNNNMIYCVHEEFLIKYYNSIKEKANILKLEKIKEKLEKMSIN